jgi:hypothetical protein
MSTLTIAAKRLLLLFAIGVASLFALVIGTVILMALGVVATPPVVSAEPARAVVAQPSVARAAQPAPSKPTCVIRIPGAPTMAVPALPTEKGFDEYGAAAAQNLSDRDMLRVLMANRGKLVDAGTRCAWADVGVTTTRARMIEGSFADQAFYFPTEWTRGTE